MVEAAETKLVRPDILTLDGRSASVITAGVVLNKFQPGPLSMSDRKDLKRIIIRNGLPGKTTRTIEYLMKGSGPVAIQYSALEGAGPTTVDLRSRTTKGMPRTAVRRNSAPACTGSCGLASTTRRLATYSFVIAGASPCATLRRLAP